VLQLVLLNLPFSSINFSLEGHLRLSLALDDEGTCSLEIFSANEVCRFLCGETGNEGFYGADPTHQALVDYWLGWEASELKVSVCKLKTLVVLQSAFITR
jgi:hypothetical protein